jgi:formylmethanofuran dehydrogenase subunit B
VDQRRTRTAEAADLFIQLRPEAHFAALWTLRALVQGVALDQARVEQSTGQPLAAWQAVADHMRRARYGAIFFTPELSAAPGGHWNAEAALALVHDLNAHTRFVTRTLRGPGNPAGADNVLAWRTGYPYAINLAAGFPRFNPDDYAARQLLARGEVDAALFVAADPLAEPELARQHRSGSFPPYVAVDWRSTVTIEHAAVSFRTATYGIHQAGIVCRTDDVPLPLRAALPTPLPRDTQILEWLEARIRQLQAEDEA